MVLPIHHDSAGRKPFPEQPLPGGLGLGLLRGRVHELCGPSRVSLAALVLGAGQGPMGQVPMVQGPMVQGPVIWISPGWVAERVYPPGLRDLTDPGRIIFARARRPEDVLWAMEEALRSGAAAMVLADLPAPPGLTPVRRLHLACEAGGEVAHHRGRLPPLALLLTPEEGGAQGVESRWHMASVPSGSTLTESRSAWVMRRLRARMAPPAAWTMTRDAGGRITAQAAP